MIQLGWQDPKTKLPAFGGKQGLICIPACLPDAGGEFGTWSRFRGEAFGA
jgi:hypothetical protein